MTGAGRRAERPGGTRHGAEESSMAALQVLRRGTADFVTGAPFGGKFNTVWKHSQWSHFSLRNKGLQDAARPRLGRGSP